ncbi:hypothetical protein Tco_0219313, partial [Tanacetum coccineum]
MAQGRLNDMVFVKYNRALDRRCKNIDTADPILLKDIDESNEWLMGHMDGEGEPATNFVYVDDDLAWAAVDIASGASEPAYPTRASISSASAHPPHLVLKHKSNILFIIFIYQPICFRTRCG